MQAVILAGGKGTRLRPFTSVIPKPLVPIGEIPILDIIIRQLHFYNITDIIIATGYLAALVETYFQRGKKWGVKIRYTKEDKPLGTAGAIQKIKGLKDNFLVMNGDILTDINYHKVCAFHLRHKAAATLATVKRRLSTDFGLLAIARDCRLIRYTEKPKRSDYVSIGINVLHKKCLQYISKNESIGIPELVRRMGRKDEKIYCYKSKAYWLDIGRMQDFQKAQEVFAKNTRRFFKPLP
jgi:NDP-sugar pyrophosphorylase family protein